MITIAGGTGTVGSKVTRNLLREGIPVRVLTRDPARAATLFGNEAQPEIVGVDIADTTGLRSAFTASESAFLSMGTSATQVRDEKLLIDAAVAAGVTHLVNLSSAGAGGDSTSNVNRWHAEIDAYVATKDVASTLLRPSTYIDTIVRVASNFVPADAWGGFAGDGRAAFIDARDIADVAALVLREGARTHAGCVYPLTGPSAVSMPQIAELLSTGLGTPVRYHHRNESEQRAVLESVGLPALMVEVLLGLDSLIRDNIAATPSSMVADLTGRPARGAANYIGENLALFAAAETSRAGA
jgi:uncharacterized protein YbjT (DUF2867 family)